MKIRLKFKNYYVYEDASGTLRWSADFVNALCLRVAEQAIGVGFPLLSQYVVFRHVMGDLQYFQ